MTDMNPATAARRILLMLYLTSCGCTPETDLPATDRQAGLTKSPVPAPDKAVRAVAPLPDFSNIADIPTLKHTFYDYFHPLVVAENDRIRAQRRRLLAVQKARRQNEQLSTVERSWLRQLAETYELAPEDTTTISDGLVDSLLLRVDIVPVPLALAQAAIESGWGRSRFARLGNNIFGQWCYAPGCGIVPGKRTPGAAHEVADFDSPALSIRSYVNNLNTHPAYGDWRRLRQRQRRGGDLDAHELVRELTAYSSLREEYVRRVRSVMRQNEHLLPDPD